MKRIVVKAKIGSDGVLRIDIPIGQEYAGQEVQVTIESVKPPMTQEEWQGWVDSMAGSWQGDFERPSQGEFEVRDSLG